MDFSPKTWRDEARTLANEVLVVGSPREAAERLGGMRGVVAETHLARDGWYSYKTTGRSGNEVRVFVELRQYPAATI